MSCSWAHLDPPIIPSVRRFSALNLARNYQYEKEHANHVSFLAGTLFKQLAPLHGYGTEERGNSPSCRFATRPGTDHWLQAAHHKTHPDPNWRYNGLPGYTSRENGPDRPALPLSPQRET